MSSSRIAAIIRSARELSEAIRVQGATPPAAALLVQRYARESGKRVLLLCPTEELASDFAADIESLSSLLTGSRIPALYCPTWEQSPYSPIAPSLRSRLARISALCELSHRNPSASPLVIVSTIAACCQATLPKSDLINHSVLIRTHDSVESREQLSRRLLDAGYLRTDPVEDPGSYAIRGEIVDVFPPDRARPIRIELFDETVERIREFDPSTQRTAEAVESVIIPPAREVLINAKTAERIREKVKARADDVGIRRASRDPVLAEIREGIYPDHSDAWAPFAYAEPATLWDYVDESVDVIWYDELSGLQEWDQFAENQRAISGEAQESQVIAPAFEALFDWNRIEARVRSASKIFLDRVALADLASIPQTPEEPAEPPDADKISATHRVFVRNNADLTHGSKQSLAELEPMFRLWLRQGFRIACLASTQSQLERIRFLLEDRGLVCILQGENHPAPEPSLVLLSLGSLSEGFRWPSEGLVIVTESELLGARHVSRKTKKGPGSSAAKEWSGLQALTDLSVGDAVVHVDHGIGRYEGLVRLSLLGAPSDFLLLEYANKDKLYLPVYRMNVIQKYVGSGESVSLDRLGSPHFSKTKERVKEAVKKLAIDLVQLYASRKIREGARFSPRDAMFREFEAKFPFDETPDQLKAIDDVLTDLESGKVMDRLVCGDVGYGKTEVAIRAAFRAVSDGKQVAVLVPTTVLAQQHEQSFKSRMKDYPIQIESVSRFKTTREQRQVLDDLASGKLDIVIGTHRLLSRDVKFHDLGLIIVDEEHRFGVEHKERLKTLRVNTHVLTLTATPIPRTLHMALSGLRDISLINTAPVDRLPIRTYVSKQDDHLIQRAIDFELSRGGQVFFVHNRIQSIFEMANRIREVCPSAQILVAHGQMPEGRLEETMDAFYRKKGNVLVSTAIIESGLDIPSANTIIINRADAFGLAQLYQIRGRVGRSQQRGYAYLLIPAEGAVTDDAKKRLEAIQRFVELGSGFSIASHDLEIRGGGDLLGPQQSGHIAAVGFDLYTELLEEAIHDLQGTAGPPEESRREPEIKAPFPAFLSEEYVPDVHQRLSLYRRFSATSSDTELNRMEEELRDRYGQLPPEAQNLLWLIRIKQLLKRVGIDALTVGPEKVSLVSGPQSRLEPSRAIALMAAHPESYQLTPDSKFVATLPTSTLRDLYFGLETLFEKLTQ